MRGLIGCCPAAASTERDGPVGALTTATPGDVPTRPHDRARAARTATGAAETNRFVPRPGTTPLPLTPGPAQPRTTHPARPPSRPVARRATPPTGGRGG